MAPNVNAVFMQTASWPMYHSAVVLQNSIIDSMRGDIVIDDTPSSLSADSDNERRNRVRK